MHALEVIITRLYHTLTQNAHLSRHFLTIHELPGAAVQVDDGNMLGKADCGRDENESNSTDSRLSCRPISCTAFKE